MSLAGLLLQDVNGISARLGLRQWFDWDRYFSYKILMTTEGNHALARSLASMVRAIYGKSRKVLVLDLDNTLWGGIIGDDGVDKIQIGRETPVAEAYTAFQEYCLSLYKRGILLAVCSKNNEEIAKQGFEHPDSVLKLEHISCFKANWEPKADNLRAMAADALRKFTGYATYSNFEISGPRWVHATTGWSWLVCVRYNDGGHPRFYSFFIDGNKVVNQRYDIVTDQCGLQPYVPFDATTGTIGSPTPFQQQPIY